ncbi:hypothetical protein [Hymenobacter arizonensis]|uniref:Uncharacterized protein n=1 Tax=Hymenobacter arizonensis TaxID=1227077 RepID=A0A1I6BD28_HYMAR|nr:hypothetical protein [Hymenobacter arizonensis]SFQ78865.1 hypothetical protein SAMN04515668_4371 [Hymenobacter arizonensis]
MLRYQRLTFFVINGAVLGWLLKVLVVDESSDSVGLFGVAVVGFLLLYAGYFAMLVRVCRHRELTTWGGQVTFLLGAVLPILAVRRLTS